MAAPWCSFSSTGVRTSVMNRRRWAVKACIILLPARCARVRGRSGGIRSDPSGRLPPFSGFLPNRLEVQDLCDLVARGEGSRHRPHADARGEVSYPAVEFSHQGDGDEIQGGRVHQQWEGLPLFG
jgi:hypothetical protein